MYDFQKEISDLSKIQSRAKKEGCNQPLSTNLASSNKGFWVSTETPFEISGNLQKFSGGCIEVKILEVSAAPPFRTNHS